MQYDVEKPEDYLSALEKDWRKELLLEIRSILLGSGELSESISYKMLGYSDDEGTLFHLNAQKNYVALYLGDINKVDPSGELLKGIDCGKGCVRFKKSTKIGDTKVADFISLAITKWKNGEDVVC